MIGEQLKGGGGIARVVIAASAPDKSEKSGGLMREAFVDEINDILRGGAGEKDFRYAGFLQGRDVRFRDDAAEDYGHIVHAFVVEQTHELRAKRVVRAGENGEADDIDVFLHGGGGNHLRRLPQAGVDHFHTGIAQSARNDLSAAVVSIEPRLRNQNPYLLLSHSSLCPLWQFSVCSVLVFFGD
jgi:hypothetical protein